MRTRRLLKGMLAAAVLLLATPMLADERPWQVKGFGVFIDGGFSTRYLDDRQVYHDDGVRFEGDYGGGFYASLEYRPTRNLGIELGHLLGAVGTTSSRYDYGTTHSSVDGTNIGFSSLLLGLNVHLTPDTRVDVSLGPVIGHMWYSKIDWDRYGYDSVSVAVRNEFAWGGNLVIDIPVAESNWSIAITAKYLDAKIESAGRPGHPRIETSFDPFVIGVGFGFRF